MNCQYACDTYNVPAQIGRKVIVNEKPGIIAKDRGNYIGVNFDKDKPGIISNCHPTWKVKYLEEFGIIRKMTRSQQRYNDYIDVCDCYESFGDYLKDLKGEV